MPLTPEGEKLLQFARESLPQWYRTVDEYLSGAANLFDQVRTQTAYLLKQTLITTAEGPTVDTPDWLLQHARDRGTVRQVGESDDALKARLRTFSDALTRGALLAIANTILAADGITDAAALLELPRDAAHFGDYTALSGTDKTFAQAGTISRFTPDDLPWPTPPYQDPAVEPVLQWDLVISGAASAGNDGAFGITGLDGDAVIVVNAAGVAGVDPSVSWTARRRDVEGNITDGFARAYLSQGYRIKNARPGLVIVILPYPTSEATAASISAALAFKKAAGIAVRIERRLVP